MDKNFSEGFVNEMVDLMEFCKENNTDNVDLTYFVDDYELNINITFSVKQN